MAIHVAIVGMGVLGRRLLKYLVMKSSVGIDVVSIGDKNIDSVVQLAYLLRNDTTDCIMQFNRKDAEGIIDYAEKTSSSDNDGIILINGIKCTFYGPSYWADKTSMQKPIGDSGATWVIDCTGSTVDGLPYLEVGAKKVLFPYYDSAMINNEAAVANPLLTEAPFSGSDYPILSLGNIQSLMLSTWMDRLYTDGGSAPQGMSLMVHSVESYTNSQSMQDSFVANSQFQAGLAGAYNLVPLIGRSDIRNIFNVMLTNKCPLSQLFNSNFTPNEMTVKTPVIGGDIMTVSYIETGKYSYADTYYQGIFAPTANCMYKYGTASYDILVRGDRAASITAFNDYSLVGVPFVFGTTSTGPVMGDGNGRISFSIIYDPICSLCAYIEKAVSLYK